MGWPRSQITTGNQGRSSGRTGRIPIAKPTGKVATAIFQKQTPYLQVQATALQETYGHLQGLLGPSTFFFWHWLTKLLQQRVLQQG